jgi:hypothetical protein
MDFTMLKYVRYVSIARDASEELPALGSLGFDPGITGFGDDEIAQILASVEPPVVADHAPW